MRPILVLLGLIAPFVEPRSAHAQVELFYARYSGLRGDTTCEYGDRYCNRCAYDVEAQFEQIVIDRDFVKSSGRWKYRATRNYEPSGWNGRELFDVLPSHGSHVQGFVRAASTLPGQPVFFVTYGDSGGVGHEHASLLAISGPSHGGPSNTFINENLMYAFPATFDHPGGMQALGEFVLTGIKETDAGAYIEFRDIAAMPADEPVILRIRDGVHNASNVAAARLAGGGYAILTNESAGRNDYNLFYSPSLEAPFLEEMWHGHIGATQSPYEVGFQNISMITECETGAIYVLGITTDSPLMDSWALYRLDTVGAEGGPQLTYLSENYEDLDDVHCNVRAGASAFVSDAGELYLYCHEKQERTTAEWVGCFLTAGVACGVGDLDLQYSEYRSASFYSPE